MKRTINLSALVISLLFLFSCKKKDTTQQPAYNSTMTAVVNGAAFTSTSTGAVKIIVAGNTQVTIGGRSSSQVISLALNNYTGVGGTFSVSGGNLSASYDPGTGATAAVSGSVIISSIDKTTYSNGVVLNGTFSFQTSANIYQVTAGAFSVFLAN